MDAVAAAGGVLHNGIVKEGEAEGVALTVEELYEYGGGIDGEGQFVGGINNVLMVEGEAHRAALVEKYLATEVGLFLKLLDEEAVGTAIEVPVDILGAFADVVLAVVGEFDGEAVKGTFVPAGDETFHHLTGKEVEGAIRGYMLRGEH